MMETTESNGIIWKKKQRKYYDHLGDLQSISISDAGTVLVSFYNLVADFSVIRVLDLDDMSNPRDSEFWASTCTSAHITPSSSMIAIGFSRQNTVHTYKMHENGLINRDSLSTIKGSSASRFGHNVALSETGLSLAVASPDIVSNSVIVGAVYTYVWVERAWTKVDSVLYGVSDIQRLGNIGIAIDDENGRIDVLQGDNSPRFFKVRFH